jgi:hypothetical protein
MTPSRHGLLFFAAAVAIAAGTRAAVALPPDPVATEDQDRPVDDGDAGSAPGEDAANVAPSPAAVVEISGAASGSLPSIGRAQATWRYGRSRGLPVDEASCRLRVSGAGRTPDGAFRGLSVGFSVALLVPAVRVGTYLSGTVPGLASAWARQDRASATPDIEWEAKDGSARDGGSAGFVVTVTSVAETSHSSERRGSVTFDVTDYEVHGAVDATLPCARSVAALRQSCHTETIHGTF